MAEPDESQVDLGKNRVSTMYRSTVRTVPLTTPLKMVMKMARRVTFSELKSAPRGSSDTPPFLFTVITKAIIWK